MERTKRVSALEGEIEAQAKNLFEEFQGFTGGVRYLTLLHRTKDAGPTSEYKRRGGYGIAHDPQEYYDILVRLLTLKAVSSKPYRLYASVNARNMAKAEKAFKMDMLTVDFDGADNKRWFWQRLPEKWVSALMQPGSRSGSAFLIDVDGVGDVTAEPLIWLAKHNVDVLKQYKTPNGWHIVTPAFNPTEFPTTKDCEIKKDGLLLLAA